MNPFAVTGNEFTRFVEVANKIVVFVVFFVGAVCTPKQHHAIILSLNVASLVRMEVAVHGFFIRRRRMRFSSLKMERVSVRLLSS